MKKIVHFIYSDQSDLQMLKNKQSIIMETTVLATMLLSFGHT